MHSHTDSAWEGGGGGDTIGGGSANREPGSYIYIYMYIYIERERQLETESDIIGMKVEINKRNKHICIYR